MCELKVFLEGEKVFEGAVYARAAGGEVSVKDILGTTKKFENVKITEIDVTSEKLVLAGV
jgi:predicted RNA-binding protein